MALRLATLRQRFHLAALLLLFPVVALLLHANLRRRIVVFPTFDLGFTQPCVDVYVTYSWPLWHCCGVFLVSQGDAEKFVESLPRLSQWEDALGVEPPSPEVGKLAANLAIALLILLATAVCSEVAIRYLPLRRPRNDSAT